MNTYLSCRFTGSAYSQGKLCAHRERVQAILRRNNEGRLLGHADLSLKKSYLSFLISPLVEARHLPPIFFSCSLRIAHNKKRFFFFFFFLRLEASAIRTASHAILVVE